MYMGQSIKSIFKPQHPEKYMGNPNNIICRSSWERVFCNWCDTRENVLRWASEEFSIKYISPVDGKPHRYYPDFIVEYRDTSGKVKKQLIEIKPKKQTKPPVPGKKVTKSFLYEANTYKVNMAKWAAAQEFCADNRIEFKIYTEEDLFDENNYNRRNYSKPKRRRKKRENR